VLQMKKIIGLVFMLAVLFGTMATFVVLESQRRPDWQIALDQYLAHSSVIAKHFTIQKVARAERPDQFRAEMGVPVRDNDDWPWDVDSLPYPPDDLYCVLIESYGRSPAVVPGNGQRQVVFVGHHSDTLWRVGWLVHAGPVAPFPPTASLDLKTVGCDLPLDE
jgi:hypothetical protein